MTACPVCTKLEAAVRVRDEAKRIAEEEYNRAYDAAFRDERFVSLVDSLPTQELRLISNRYIHLLLPREAVAEMLGIDVVTIDTIRRGSEMGGKRSIATRTASATTNEGESTSIISDGDEFCFEKYCGARNDGYISLLRKRLHSSLGPLGAVGTLTMVKDAKIGVAAQVPAFLRFLALIILACYWHFVLFFRSPP
jgi:hypothetical protein